MDVNTLIGNYGFPITCCVSMAIFIYKIWQKNAETNEKTITALNIATETNKELAKNNADLAKNNAELIDNNKNIILKVDKIESDVNGIKLNIDNILNNIQK